MLLLGGYILVLGIMGVCGGGSVEPALGRDVSTLLVVSAKGLGIFGVVFGLACLASCASADDLLLRWRPSKWVVLLGLGYSIVLRVAIGVAAGTVSLLLIGSGLVSQEEIARFATSNRPEVEALVDVKALQGDSSYFWLTTTLVSFVVAGLREELWRAGFMAALSKLWPGLFGSTAGQFLAVGIAAVSFGSAHAVQGVIAVGVTALLGFGLGAIMIVHRSIWPAVVAHGCFNSTSFALLPWAMELMK